jgi:hypothetical protein
MLSRTKFRKFVKRLRNHARVREIAVAAVLTIAAIAFIAVAMLRGDLAHERGAPYATARKGPSP